MCAYRPSEHINVASAMATRSSKGAIVTVDPVLRVGVVMLTDGTRPRAVAAAVASVANQALDERILVANGAYIEPLEGWTVVHSEVNLGVPGGRSLGIASSTSDVLIFLDDDSTARSPDLAAGTRDIFATDPSLGALAYRVVVTGSEESLRRWVPAHRQPDASGLCDAATFPGNGHAVRRQAFSEAGGYTNEFFFKHEETELSWKLLDAGWNVRYSADLVVEHPRTVEGRHGVALRFGSRNKVWLTRALLPLPLRWPAIVFSQLRLVAQARSPEEILQIGSGIAEGLRSNPIERRPISWATVRALIGRGRPPLF